MDNKNYTAQCYDIISRGIGLAICSHCKRDVELPGKNTMFHCPHCDRTYTHWANEFRTDGDDAPEGFEVHNLLTGKEVTGEKRKRIYDVFGSTIDKFLEGIEGDYD